MSLRNFSALFVAALGLLMTGNSAYAAPLFQLEFYVDTVLQGTAVVDNDVNDAFDGVDGHISFNEEQANFSIDGFKVSLTSAITNVNDLGGVLATLTNNISVVREHDGTGSDPTGARTLKIVATVTDFMFPDLGAYLLTSKFSGTALSGTYSSDALASFESFFDDDNDPSNGFGTPAPLSTADNTSIGTGSWGGPAFTTTAVSNGSTPFALVSQTIITLTNNKAELQTTGITEASAVPEPGTMALLALGGIGLAGARLRRRKAA